MQQEILQQNKQTVAFLFHLAETYLYKATQENSNEFGNSQVQLDVKIKCSKDARDGTCGEIPSKNEHFELVKELQHNTGQGKL